MCERARRSRDASSRYSIDTLFPGLSNNSAHARNTTEESCVVADQKEDAGTTGAAKAIGAETTLPLPTGTATEPGEVVSSITEENNTNNSVVSAEVGVGTDGGKRREDGGGNSSFRTPANSPSSPAPAVAVAGPESSSAPSSSGRRRNQNNSGSGSCYNGNNHGHKGRPSKRVNEGSDDRLVKEGKSSRSSAVSRASVTATATGSGDESVDNNNGVCMSKPNSVGSRGSSSSSSTTSSAVSPSAAAANGNSSKGSHRGNSRASATNNGTTPGTTGRKRTGSPLKPTTIQPKQMSLLSTSKMSRKTMYEAFQPWVLRTYGDSAKTKTITKKKYCRIVKTLRGEELNNAENSKFRFWVKAKGFHIGPPAGHPHLKDDFFPFAHNNNNDDDGAFGCYMDPELYVPTTVKDGSSIEKSVYKRVAVVEYFFDIIYTVHVETEAKNGKHAGQKRTYRAITEKYAFLPREAVTKFLLQCMECQKRGSPGGGNNHHNGAIGLLADTVAANGKVAVDSLTPSPDSSAAFLTSHPHHEAGTSATLLSSSLSAAGAAAAMTLASATTTISTPETSPLALAVAGAGSSASSTSSSSSSSSSSGGTNANRGWKNCNNNGRRSSSNTPISDRYYNNNNGRSLSPPSSFDINFSLPFTTTYLRQQEQQQKQHLQHMRLRNGFKPDQDDDEDTHMSDANSEEDHEHHQQRVKGGRGKSSTNDSKAMDTSSGATSDLSTAAAGSATDWLGYHPLGLKKEPPPNGSNNNVYSNGKHDFREQSSPLSLSERGGTNHEVVHDETSSNGNKEDEDDDDDDSEDKMDTHQYDPERLKAFNMFVRLFVDENLDRMVPISKQPKEKIQAIIDSCTRQFPEFAERARKRIRTYLKSCRRNKRSRDTNGWESTRPTPAHLTSVQAEQILAQACENESQNAKRMRMGLEPVSQPLPMPPGETRNSKENGVQNSSGDSSPPEKSSKSSPAAPPAAHSLSNAAATITAVAANTTSVSSSSPGLPSDGMNNQNLNLSLNGGVTSANVEGILGQHPSTVNSANKSLDRSPLVDYSRTLNGNGVPNMSMYRPNFGQPFPRSAPFPSLFPPTSAAAVAAAAAAAAVGGTSSFPHNVSPLPVSNGDAGPTDLSMKSKPLLTHKLNATELATVRQLITGYRESAAFLLRSADELEQLLIQQQ